MKRQQDQRNSDKRQHLIGLAYRFIELVHNDGKQTGIVLGQELRALYPHPQAERDWTCQGCWKPHIPPSVTHFLPGHTPSPSPTVPLTGDQALKHRSLRGPFSFNHSRFNPCTISYARVSQGGNSRTCPAPSLACGAFTTPALLTP